MALNHIDALLNKFRLQMKKMRKSVEKACNKFDPKNIGSVKKKNSSNNSLVFYWIFMKMNFSDFLKIFVNSVSKKQLQLNSKLIT